MPVRMLHRFRRLMQQVLKRKNGIRVAGLHRLLDPQRRRSSQAHGAGGKLGIEHITEAAQGFSCLLHLCQQLHR